MDYTGLCWTITDYARLCQTMMDSNAHKKEQKKVRMTIIAMSYFAVNNIQLLL